MVELLDNTCAVGRRVVFEQGLTAVSHVPGYKSTVGGFARMEWPGARPFGETRWQALS